MCDSMVGEGFGGGSSACWAEIAGGRISAAATCKQIFVILMLSMRILLEREVEPEHQAATGQVDRQSGCRRHHNFSLPHNGVFVVESEARAAADERVVAKAKGKGVYVAEIARVRIERLLAHADQFIAVDENHLWIESVVRLKQRSIPSRSVSTGRQAGAARVRWRIGPKIDVVVAVEIHCRDVQLLEVPHADEPRPVVRFISRSCAVDRPAAAGVLGKS